jgi:hypothetical protein
VFAIVGGQQQFNLDGNLTDRQLQGYLGYTSLGFWNWNALYMRRQGAYDDQILRGGPLVRHPGLDIYVLSMSTDSRRALRLEVSPSYVTDDIGGHDAALSASATWKPASNLLITFGPNYEAGTAPLQFVTSTDDPTATAFYGHRYVLSSIRQRTLSLDTRVAATFTPRMTLEIYAQPFIASGQYFDYKEFTAPRTLSTSVYGRDRGTITALRDKDGVDTAFVVDPDAAGAAAPFRFTNPDFNVRSLRGNAVFRWEYRPGSTLYVVWTQSRSDAVQLGNFDFPRDRRALLAAHPDNVFLVKVSYWLGS